MNQCEKTMSDYVQTWIDRQITSFCDTFKIEYGKRGIYSIYGQMLCTNERVPVYRLSNIVFLTYHIQKCAFSIVNIQTKQRGSAILKRGDMFDVHTGVAIAWARYRNKPVPEYLTVDRNIEYPSYDGFCHMAGEPILFDYEKGDCGKEITFDMRDFTLTESGDIEYKYFPLNSKELYDESYNYRYADD